MKSLKRRSVTFALVLVAFNIIGCGTPSNGASERSAPSAKALRLYVFDCGTILQVDPARFRLTREEVSMTNLAVPCFLVVHPQGRLMWDPGAVPDTEWTPTGGEVSHRLVLPGWERKLTLRKPLMAQLASAGYSPSDITHLAFSHYHYDHTANANAFASATWLVRQNERDAMFADPPPPVTRPATYSALRNSKTVIIQTNDHDVFGDGTVILKLAAGHTPGHQVLYVKLPKTSGVVLSGDLYHFPEARRLKRVPTFDFDQEQTPHSRNAIEAFLQSAGAQLWIQHDFMANARLKKAPDFYE